jgi:hypothetical protein
MRGLSWFIRIQLENWYNCLKALKRSVANAFLRTMKGSHGLRMLARFKGMLGGKGAIVKEVYMDFNEVFSLL